MKENIHGKLADLKTVTIVFDDSTSHAEVVTQFVEKLVKAKFAPKREIIEHLEMAKALLNRRVKE